MSIFNGILKISKNTAKEIWVVNLWTHALPVFFRCVFFFVHQELALKFELNRSTFKGNLTWPGYLPSDHFTRGPKSRQIERFLHFNRNSSRIFPAQTQIIHLSVYYVLSLKLCALVSSFEIIWYIFSLILLLQKPFIIENKIRVEFFVQFFVLVQQVGKWSQVKYFGLSCFKCINEHQI